MARRKATIVAGRQTDLPGFGDYKTDCKNADDKLFCMPIKGLLVPFKGKGGEPNLRVLRNDAEQALDVLLRQREQLVAEFAQAFPRSGSRLPFRLYLHQGKKKNSNNSKLGDQDQTKNYAYLFWSVRRGAHRGTEMMPPRVKCMSEPMVQPILARLPVGVRQIYLDFDLSALKLETMISEATRTVGNLNQLLNQIALWQDVWTSQVQQGSEPGRWRPKLPKSKD